MFYVIGGILLVIGVIVLLIGISKAKLQAAMAGMETSDIANLQHGTHVEVKGTADIDSPLTAPGSDVSCVYYEYEVQRLERTRDSDGKEKDEWRTIDSGKSEATFHVSDATGSVLIEPRGAKMDCPVVADRYITPGEGGGGGLMGTIIKGLASLSSNREKIRTRAIGIGQALYILGNVTVESDMRRIGKGKERFFISTRSEEELTKSLGWQSKLMKVIGIVLGVGGVALIVLQAAGVIGKS